MADGNGPAVLTRAQLMESPLPWRFQDAPEGIGPTAYGICDPNFTRVKQGAELWRYSTVYMKWTRDAVTGHLTLAAGQSKTLFAVGDDQAGTDTLTGYLYTSSDVETDTNKDGAPVKEGEMFSVRAFGFLVGKPVLRVDGNDNLLTSPAWLTRYERHLQEFTQQRVSVGIEFEDSSCDWVAGLVSFWPAHAQPTGGEIVSLGRANGLSSVAPLRRKMYSGARDQTDKGTLVLATGTAGVRLEQDDAFETTGDVFVPIVGLWYGDPNCVCAPVCAPSDINQLADQLLSNPQFTAALLQKLANRR